MGRNSILKKLFIIFIGICFWPITILVLLCKYSKKKKSKETNSVIPVQNQSTSNFTSASRSSSNIFTEPITFNVETTVRQVPNKIENLSRIDFGKPEGEPYRFLNYFKYEVKGKSESGKATFKIKYACTEQSAISQAERDGLYPPFEIKILTPEPATERQIECLRKNNVSFPDEINKDVAHDMLSRTFGEDSEESPEPWLVELATSLEIPFTAYIGHESLLHSALMDSGIRNTAALYAYAVKQNLKGLEFGNMLKDKDVEKFYRFSDIVLADDSLIKSLQGRNTYDFLHPQKNAKIYKAALNYLVDNQ